MLKVSNQDISESAHVKCQVFFWDIFSLQRIEFAYVCESIKLAFESKLIVFMTLLKRNLDLKIFYT